MTVSYIVGADLGQQSDYTAVAALSRETLAGKSSYTLAGLHRYPLGTPYTSPDPQRPGVGQQLKALLSAPPLPGCILAVDQTGVGRAVVDVLRGLDLPCAMIPITITAGRQATETEFGEWHVPKADLVAVLQVLLQSRRLVIRPELRLAQTLIAELDSFRVKVTAAANETFSAREGQHDDLVLAVALSLWTAERCPAFTRESIGMGGREPASVPGRGVSLHGDFRAWPKGV